MLTKYLTEIIKSYKLNERNNINPFVLWRCLYYIRDLNNLSHDEKVNLSLEVVKYFRCIVKTSEYLISIFDESPIMCMELLKGQVLYKLSVDGYLPVPFKPDADIGVKQKIIWLTTGWDTNGRRYAHQDYFYVDYSVVHDVFIRSDLIRYTLTEASVSYAATVSQVARTIGALYDFKMQNNIPVDKIRYSDFTYLKTLCVDSNGGSDYHLQAYLKKFLEYLNFKHPGFVDESGYKLLKVQSTVTKKVKAIPDNDFKLLEEALRKRADIPGIKKALDEKRYIGEVRNFQYYMIFLLLSRTKMRISTLLELEKDDIFPGQKKDVYIVQTKTKKSDGKTEQIVLSDLTYRILQDCISIANMKIGKYKIKEAEYLNKIFLIVWKGQASTISITSFERYLTGVCSDIGIPDYGPDTIRKRYMTKAEDKAISENLTDLDLQQLTGHASEDVTLESYFTFEISKLVEGLYHVTIGDQEILHRIDAKNKIGDIELDQGRLVGGEADKELGYCKAECKGNSVIACYCCPNFYTTCAHLPNFKNELKRLQFMKTHATQQHDVETIQLKANVVAMYVAAIYEKNGGKK